MSRVHVSWEVKITPSAQCGTPPRSEKNGFEPEFEPPFWDILADMGGRPAITSSLLAGRNNPTIEEEVDVI